jgi:hypothetical protein
MRLFFCVALLLAAASAAQARPRDEVMSGAFRCAPLESSRQWLDCYYGAAQPARAALGLAPAPAAQVQLSRVTAGSQGPVQDGAIRDQVMSGAFACSRAADERAWLDCYYGAAQPMRGRLGLAPAPQATNLPQANNQRAKAAPLSRPAMVAPAGLLNEDVTRIRMASYTFDKNSMFTVTLANGQSWKQRADDTAYAHWKGPASSHVVSVSGGTLGHWRLEDERDHTVYSVQPAR